MHSIPMEALAIGVEGIASRVEAIAIRFRNLYSKLALCTLSLWIHIAAEKVVGDTFLLGGLRRWQWIPRVCSSSSSSIRASRVASS